jgi:hypothetical protein
VRGRSASVRALGGAALAGVVLYAVSSASAGGRPGTQSCFAYNLRFLVPALAVGLLAPSISVSRRMTLLLSLVLGVVLITALASTRPAGPVALAAGFAVALGCCSTGSSGPPRSWNSSGVGGIGWGRWQSC